MFLGITCVEVKINIVGKGLFVWKQEMQGLFSTSLCLYLVSEIVPQLLPPPPVSQSNCDRSLRIGLTNNIFIQLIDNLLWLEHVLETGREHRRDGDVLCAQIDYHNGEDVAVSDKSNTLNKLKTLTVATTSGTTGAAAFSVLKYLKFLMTVLLC